jgi:uncharacterized protein (TIGR03435 family)
LEGFLRQPVVDETGLKDHYSIDLRWQNSGQKLPAIRKALREQLGLDLVPGRETIEVLMVDKEKN